MLDIHGGHYLMSGLSIGWGTKNLLWWTQPYHQTLRFFDDMEFSNQPIDRFQKNLGYICGPVDDQCKFKRAGYMIFRLNLLSAGMRDPNLFSNVRGSSPRGRIAPA